MKLPAIFRRVGQRIVAGSLLVLLVALGAGLASAQPADDAPPVFNLQSLGIGGPPGAGGGGGAESVQFSATYRLLRGTKQGTVALTAEIDPGWHVFSVTQPAGGPATSKIKLGSDSPFKITGPFVADRDPEIIPADIFPVPAEEHHDKVVWTAPIELTGTAEPADTPLQLVFNGQVCSDQTCIPLTNEKIAARFAGYVDPPANAGEYRPNPIAARLKLQGHIEPATVAPGGKARLQITAIPDPGWHVYAYARADEGEIGNKPTLIVLSRLGSWRQSPVRASVEPIAEPSPDPAIPAQPFHAEPVTWTIDLSVPADSATGEFVLQGQIGFQTCDVSCLPPAAAQFRVSIPVGAKEVAGQIPLEFSDGKYSEVAALAAKSPPPGGPVDFGKLGAMIGFGLLGGLILNLMPCVLPVIGLKVLSFAEQGGQSRGRVFLLNLWYSLGLISVFLVLATLAAFLNLGWGEQFTLTWFKVAMVMVVFAMALSFLGVWEVPIPGFASSSASDTLQKKEGISGAFFKGIFTTVLATPCSGPFLGPVFAYTLAQPPLVTYVIFGSVGVGMASPYLLIGLFPGFAKLLPKAGPWMETFKQIMAFVLLGTVVYLFATISPDYFIPTLALMMGTWFACWLIGRVPVYEDVGKQLVAWASGIAAAAVVGYAAFTFLGPQKELLPWEPYSPATLAKLQAEGKTVMVDFTANWCLTCQYNLRYAINTRGVQTVVEKNSVVPMVADWTDRSDEIKNKLLELNSKSIPLLAIYPANRPGDVIVLRDTLVESQVVAALEEAGPSQAVAGEKAMSGNKTAEAKATATEATRREVAAAGKPAG